MNIILPDRRPQLFEVKNKIIKTTDLQISETNSPSQEKTKHFEGASNRSQKRNFPSLHTSSLDDYIKSSKRINTDPFLNRPNTTQDPNTNSDK